MIQATATLRREGSFHSIDSEDWLRLSAFIICITSVREKTTKAQRFFKCSLYSLCLCGFPLYSYFQSGSSGCFKSHRGRGLCTVGGVSKLYSGGGDEVDHSRVHASHGSFPAISPLFADQRIF